MKRLLAGGQAKAIYQITRAFRGAEAGDQHNPEFTMLEWYRIGDDYQQGTELLAELAKEMFGANNVERVAYRQAFQEIVGADPLLPRLEAFQAAAKRHQLAPPVGLAFPAQWIDWLQSVVLQPRLGVEQPTILYDFPGSQSALAQTREESGLLVAERFELFYRGVELANGYHELLDPEVLAKRNAHINALRELDGKPRLPEESRLLAAMRHGLPRCSGCALGVDRLVMLLAGASSIQEVIAFPIDRA
jgi:lysyl-tRNA synthetase class 2